MDAKMRLCFDLNLSVRASRIIESWDYEDPPRTIDELANKTFDDLWRCKGCGPITIAEIQAALEARGRSLKRLPRYHPQFYGCLERMRGHARSFYEQTEPTFPDLSGEWAI